MIFIISGPSGSGKSTLIRYLKEEKLPIYFPVSATDRPLRLEEDKNGLTYWFYTTEKFEEMIKNGYFVEYVKLDHYYGTLWSELKKAREKNILLELDVHGALKIRNLFPKETVLIFIAPPSFPELQRRLMTRSDGINDQEKRNRLKRAEAEMESINQYDHILINNELEKCKVDIYSVLHGYLHSSYEEA